MPVQRNAGVHAGPADARAELQQLSDALDAKRVQMNLPEPGATSAAVQPIGPHTVQMATPVSSRTDTTCHPAASDTCTTTCTLADDICDKAARICTLADELAGDTDARAKCDRGNATCTAAHAKCCGCQL